MKLCNNEKSKAMNKKEKKINEKNKTVAQDAI